MPINTGQRVTTLDGPLGVVVGEQPSDTTSEPQTIIQSDAGQQVVVPSSLLRLQENGTYVIAMHTHALSTARAASAADTTVVPVVAEELMVGKRTVATGKVRIRTTVHEQAEVVDEPLLRDEVEVTRVPINQFVERPVDARYEGETLIVPIFEEVLVVEKRLVLKEELHITRRRAEYHAPQQVTLRREEINIERLPLSDEERAERGGGTARIE